MSSLASILLRVKLAVSLALVLLSMACTRSGSQRPLSAALRATTPSGQPTVLAAYQPWFGRGGHINVGYSSQDRTVLQRQIEEARGMGISGFVVNWYGPRHPFEDKSYALMQQLANASDFKLAIMYDEDDSDPSNSTDAVIVDLQYAYDRYIAPHAQVPNTSYLRYNGRPLIFIFPKGNSTDWQRVRQTVSSWEDPPLLIYKDIPTKNAQLFDGFYAWVQPGKRGWQRDGSNWGREYLENFYLNMNNQYPDKLAVGAAWPGFDDTRASWGRNRKMDARCGKTFDDALALYRRYYDRQRPLPFLMIETWNDYEEGTAIERGYATCGNSQRSLASGGD